MTAVPIQNPPRPRTEAGDLRRVGVEIEFNNLTLEHSARLIQDCFGGRVLRKNDYFWQVFETKFGDFDVELDANFLKKRTLEKTLGLSVEKVVGALVETLTPNEIVCPPLPYTKLAELEKLRRALIAAGAEDTHQSVMNAFGVHLNPEVPATDVDTILSVLRAYLILEGWLHERLGIDRSRSLTPFINPFPQDYINRVIAPDYAPDLVRLIDDYLEYNPTRNRGLDMLPLFAFLDEARVMEALPGHKIKGRPTYHYRLPNSSLEGKKAALIQEWNDWVFVEEVAENKGLLHQLMNQYSLALLAGKEEALYQRYDELIAPRETIS